VSAVADEKQQRVNVCEELRQSVSDDEIFLSRVITGDPERRQQSSQWKNPTSSRQKEPRQVKSKVKRMSIIFFNFKENSSCYVKQSIMHITVTCYGNCLKMCEDFAQSFGSKELAVASLQRTVSHFSSEGNFLTKNNITVVALPPYFTQLQLKIKLKGRHFDIIMVVEAESQAMLNILTGYDLQDAF
jgi:hypothetical protein